MQIAVRGSYQHKSCGTRLSAHSDKIFCSPTTVSKFSYILANDSWTVSQHDMINHADSLMGFMLSLLLYFEEIEYVHSESIKR